MQVSHHHEHMFWALLIKHALKLLFESYKKALPISVTYLTNNNSQTLWTMMVCPPESQKSDESSNRQS